MIYLITEISPEEEVALQVSGKLPITKTKPAYDVYGNKMSLVGFIITSFIGLVLLPLFTAVFLPIFFLRFLVVAYPVLAIASYLIIRKKENASVSTYIFVLTAPSCISTIVSIFIAGSYLSILSGFLGVGIAYWVLDKNKVIE